MKKTKKLIIGLIIFSMMAMYGSVPVTRAASLTASKDLLSDSDLGALSTHTITFTMGTALVATDYVEITFPGGAGGFSTIDSANATCPGNMDAPTHLGNVLTCTANGAVAGTYTVTITGVTNPSGYANTGSKLIQIRTKNASDVEIEKADIMVAILDNVTMTATVSATLEFTVSGTTTAAVINGVPVSNNSTATTTPFGTLVVGATSTVGQDLSVITNADQGYVVTVYQDDELRNTTNSTINSFNNSADGTGTTTPEAWAAPLGVLDQNWTYGHMGLTTSDANLQADGGPNSFVGGLFAGLSSTTPMEVMRHTGPADGQTQNRGYASVLYQAEIHALQEAGDYTNTITYICTPTY